MCLSQTKMAEEKEIKNNSTKLPQQAGKLYTTMQYFRPYCTQGTVNIKHVACTK